MTATHPRPTRPCADHFVGTETLTCAACGWVDPMGQYLDEIMATDECAATAASAPYETGAQSPTVLALVSVASDAALPLGEWGSASVCAFDAWRQLAIGNELGAVRWALRSLEHSVGVFSPVFRSAVSDAVRLFPLEGLDTYRVLGGAVR